MTPGGLGWDELATGLDAAVGSGKAVGIDVTIFNPRLDEEGSIAQKLAEALARGLRA